MSLIVFLDAGPLGLIINPKRTTDTIAATKRAIDIMAAEHRFVVPSIADYEVRLELIRAGKTNGLMALDAWNSARPDRFLLLSQTALHMGAQLWAHARKSGAPLADPKDLPIDEFITTMQHPQVTNLVILLARPALASRKLCLASMD